MSFSFGTQPTSGFSLGNTQRTSSIETTSIHPQESKEDQTRPWYAKVPPNEDVLEITKTINCFEDGKNRKVPIRIHRLGRSLLHLETELALDRIYDFELQDKKGFEIKVITDALVNDTYRRMYFDDMKNTVNLLASDELDPHVFHMREISQEERKKIKARERAMLTEKVGQMEKEMREMHFLLSLQSLVSVYNGARVVSHPNCQVVIPDFVDPSPSPMATPNWIKCTFPNLEHEPSSALSSVIVKEPNRYVVTSDPIIVKLADDPISINRVLIGMLIPMISNSSGDDPVTIFVDASLENDHWSTVFNSSQMAESVFNAEKNLVIANNSYVASVSIPLKRQSARYIRLRIKCQLPEMIGPVQPSQNNHQNTNNYYWSSSGVSERASSFNKLVMGYVDKLQVTRINARCIVEK